MVSESSGEAECIFEWEFKATESFSNDNWFKNHFAAVFLFWWRLENLQDVYQEW